jgi:hypothetical protein
MPRALRRYRYAAAAALPVDAMSGTAFAEAFAVADFSLRDHAQMLRHAQTR